MLAVILWILKIIGVLLLVLLGLILLLVLAVLLSPVCYRAEGSWYGELKASAAVSWLFHIVSLRAEYGERREVVLRIFGVRVGAERVKKSRKKPGEEQETAADSGTREESVPEPPVRKTGSERASELPDRKTESESASEESGRKTESGSASEPPGRKTESERASEPPGRKTESESAPEPPGGQAEDEKAPELAEQRPKDKNEPEQGTAGGKQTFSAKNAGDPEKTGTDSEKTAKPSAPADKNGKQRFSIRRFCDKLKAAIPRVCHAGKAARDRVLGIPKLAARGKAGLGRARRKVSEVGDKKEKLIAFFKDENNQKTLKLLKRQIFALLKHVLPRKIKGKVRFGFDDPYTTGQVLMYAAPFYGLYAKSLELIPVFEEPVLEGELYLRGRVRIGTVLVLAGRMMLDRNFRSLLKKWRKG